ncbi:MAG TPA: lipid-A-disaccharide synthase [Alphaproteobacteria bacterium]|nr:lipid-A-disaccharide synthase [Alphaproteobacteria bacterium]
MSERTPLVYLVAGEPSGDLLGGRLMAALKALTGGRIRFAGIGGAAMEAEGLASQFPMSELAVMGIVEVIPHAPRILRRVNETATAAKSLRPDAVVTIDAPAFAFRVGKKLKGAGIPLIHYVAPSVWAWRPRRAHMIAQFLDHLLVFLPFEPPYFLREGLAATFVGHPAVEAPKGDGAAFRRRHAIPEGARVLAMLPGSRRGEIGRHLPIFRDTVAMLARRLPGLHLVVPTVPTVDAEVRAAVAGFGVPATVVGADEKYDAFAAADVALAASGTVVLELAAAGLPMVVTYRVTALSAFIARRMVKVSQVSLVNLVLGRPAVSELIQEQCRPDLLSTAVAELFDNEGARTRQKADLAETVRALTPEHGRPSERAAEVVLEIARRSMARKETSGEG